MWRAPREGCDGQTVLDTTGQTSSIRNQFEPNGVSLIVYDVSPLGRPRVPQ